MAWALTGVVLSLVACALAVRASRLKSDYYSEQIYGMSPRSHGRFAVLCLAFAGAFGLAAAWPLLPLLPIFAAFVLAAVLYGTSFLRGYADEDS